MSIITMCKKHHPDATLWDNSTDERPIYTRSYAVGCVLRTWEHNGYHDSDFHAAYWDEDKGEVVSVMYASTRGWTYPCYGTFADATPEVVEKAKVWETEQARQRAIKLKWLDRKYDKTASFEMGLPTYHQVRKLREAVGSERFDAVRVLLQTRANNRFRSKFRKSLADQVYRWVLDDSPAFDTPLSQKQWRCIA